VAFACKRVVLAISGHHRYRCMSSSARLSCISSGVIQVFNRKPSVPNTINEEIAVNFIMPVGVLAFPVKTLKNKKSYITMLP
jgi:hypothetical protein